jgi:hypothetical protein
MPPSPAPRYTLRRLNWRRTDLIAGFGVDPGRNHGWFRLPGTSRVATFADADAAESERLRLEAEARAVINPFRCGSSLTEQTSLDEGRLCDWLLDHGLTPPGRKPRNWVRWYDNSRSAMDDYQRQKVWEALDRLHFYEVVEGPARPLVFVAVEIEWGCTTGTDGRDEFYTGDEGGKVRHVFRTRGEAERFYKSNWSGGWYGNERFEMTNRQHLREDPLGLREPVEVWFDEAGPEYDIVEAEVLDSKGRGEVLSPSAFGAKLFVVTRAAFWLEIDGRKFDLHCPAESRVPIAAFTDRARAEAHEAELTRQAWAELSPGLVIRHKCLLEYLSTHKESEWIRRLKALGIELPAKETGRGMIDKYDWDAWGDSVPAPLSVEGRAAIWSLCDRVRLYDVVEVAPKG